MLKLPHAQHDIWVRVLLPPGLTRLVGQPHFRLPVSVPFSPKMVKLVSISPLRTFFPFPPSRVTSTPSAELLGCSDQFYAAAVSGG